LWHSEAADAVRCDLCAHRCLILPGGEGVCGVRVNDSGALKTLVLNRLVSAWPDPIEKKPLFHFLPGAMAFSIAAPGCNFHCDYCQNWQISQAQRAGGTLPGEIKPPDAVVEAAMRSRCEVVAYTYTEPTIFFETAEAVGLKARTRGLKNIFVTNGYLTREAVGRAVSFLDAANVDLKGFDDAKYRKVCGASLRGVLDGISFLLAAGIWVEITTLIVPGLNDSDRELNAMARHIAGLGRHIPWHLSRYHPDYKMAGPHPTPLATLERAWRAGRGAGLDFIYLGNTPGHASESTACPTCGTMVIGRDGFRLTALALREGKCPSCGEGIAGLWSR
jgi:pyruvate formate lyase activating enzyme